MALCDKHSYESDRWLDYRLPSVRPYASSALNYQVWRDTIRNQQALIAAACDAGNGCAHDWWIEPDEVGA